MGLKKEKENRNTIRYRITKEEYLKRA